jgi:hypothetical protein
MLLLILSIRSLQTLGLPCFLHRGPAAAEAEAGSSKKPVVHQGLEKEDRARN